MSTAMSSLSEVRATVAACEAAYKSAKAEAASAYRHLIECRDERKAVISGDMTGDAGICWTNEERAQARYDEACDRQNEARDERDDAYDWESDCLSERVPNGLGAYAD